MATMKLNELIRMRRKELGLREADVAAQAALGREAYRDIEWDENEAYTNVELLDLRAICKILGLDLLSMFDIECRFCSSAAPTDDVFDLPRNDLIAQRRIALGLTRDQLADRIGFETIAVEQMEQDPDFLERWSVELIERLATELRTPPQALLRVRCDKCGQGGSG